MLMEALSDLTEDERFLIDALFYQNRSEREVADSFHISHQAVHKKKKEYWQN
jgi:DNA-directed RNA polymerase specialized sigma subunit